MESPSNGGNQCFLPAQCPRVEVCVYASKGVRQECEEIKLHRQIVFSRGHQKSFHRSQRAFVGVPFFVAEFVPACPPSGAKHIDTIAADLREVSIPDGDVRMIEEQTLDVTRHIRSADDG